MSANIQSGEPAPGVAGIGAGRDVQVIGLVALVHGVSHFFHLILVPLFPWLIDEFAFSYSQLGLLMTVFFVVSGLGQTGAGFLVDRIGAVPVLLGALGLFVAGALVLAASDGLTGFMLGMILAGLGNAPFHPIDFSIINARIRAPLLGRAYAAHGISGSLGWALAPVFLAGIASLSSWRLALVGAAVLAGVVLLLACLWRHLLSGDDRRASGIDNATGTAARHATGAVSAARPVGAPPGTAGERTGAFAFMRLPAVWMSFVFFVVYAFSLGGVQGFAPSAAGLMHGLPPETLAICLTAFMLGSAAGMVPGGWVATSPERAEKLIAIGFSGALIAALSMVLLAWPAAVVPVIFAIMGFSSGFANPARDLLIKRATPPGATGRVYGVVYSGLDVGMATGPLVFGLLMDAKQPQSVWLLIALTQLLLIGIAFFAGRFSTKALTPASA